MINQCLTEKETNLGVHVIDVHKELSKTRHTSLVVRIFEGFLGAL